MNFSNLINVASMAFNAALPARCIMCGGIVYGKVSLCSSCFAEIDFITKPFCELCGFPFETETEGEKLCAECVSRKPYYDKNRSAIVYNDASKKMILAFKHGDRTDSAPVFAEWLVRVGNDILLDSDFIIPVPLHRIRLFTRRYNQSALLVQSVVKKLNKFKRIKPLYNVLIRSKNTPSQGKYSKRARYMNVHNAFEIKNAKMIKGKNIVIIDDVMTTGATIQECSRILKKAGAAKIYSLTLAKAVNRG